MINIENKKKIYSEISETSKEIDIYFEYKTEKDTQVYFIEAKSYKIKGVEKLEIFESRIKQLKRLKPKPIFVTPYELGKAGNTFAKNTNIELFTYYSKSILLNTENSILGINANINFHMQPKILSIYFNGKNADEIVCPNQEKGELIDNKYFYWYEINRPKEDIVKGLVIVKDLGKSLEYDFTDILINIQKELNEQNSNDNKSEILLKSYYYEKPLTLFIKDKNTYLELKNLKIEYETYSISESDIFVEHPILNKVKGFLTIKSKNLKLQINNDGTINKL